MTFCKEWKRATQLKKKQEEINQEQEAINRNYSAFRNKKKTTMTEITKLHKIWTQWVWMFLAYIIRIAQKTWHEYWIQVKIFLHWRIITLWVISSLQTSKRGSLRTGSIK